MTQAQLLKLIIKLLDEKKAENIVSLDISKLTDFADYMVICSGTSPRHVGSLAEYVAEEVKKKGRSALGIEGKGQGEWSLVDYGDIIVQVMLPKTREFYALEKLWENIAETAEVLPKETRKKTKTTKTKTTKAKVIKTRAKKTVIKTKPKKISGKMLKTVKLKK